MSSGWKKNDEIKGGNRGGYRTGVWDFRRRRAMDEEENPTGKKIDTLKEDGPISDFQRNGPIT